jgi:hypothetical protein
MSRKRATPKAKTPFDKYFMYTHSVQGAEHDAELLWKMTRKLWSGPLPSKPILQEDFCATAALCYEWVKLGKHHQAVGLDLDSTALGWGATHHSESLTESQASRVKLIHGDVLHNHNVYPHVICALNFSYFFIKERALLKKYFSACRKSLAKNGVLILDAFGGPDYLMSHVDRRRNNDESFTYWWEIESFDAVSHQIKCHLHFQRDGEKRRDKVFSYDWRLWSLPEITDVLRESGFKHVEYWAEGLNRKGRGNGVFKPIKSEKECSTWITYLVAK